MTPQTSGAHETPGPGEEIEGRLEALDREDRRWDGEEARDARRAERRTLVAGALRAPSLMTLTTARAPGRAAPRRGWGDARGAHPIAIVAIECGVDAAELAEGLRARPARARARAADGETVWEALRRAGHEDEAAVLGALEAADPGGAAACRAPADGRGAAWPAARIALWRGAGCAPTALEALGGWTPGERASERWAEVERGLGDAGALLGALGHWNATYTPEGGSRPEAGALGGAIARTCEGAQPEALRAMVARLTEEEERAGGGAAPWARAGGARVLGRAAGASARLRAVLARDARSGEAWRAAGERELARAARGRERRWRDEARQAEGDAAWVALLEGVLALGVAPDGVLRSGEREGARWGPVLAFALEADAPARTLARLIEGGADPATPDSEGANAWHVLMRRPERPDEDAVVETLRRASTPEAMGARCARGHRPEDGAGAWGGGRWSAKRIARYRAAGAAVFDAGTVLRTGAAGRGTGDEETPAERWRLAARGPGGPAAALAECAGERTRAWLWTVEGVEGMRELGAAIAATARGAGVAPEAFIETLGGGAGEGLAHGGTTLVAGVLEAWPALGAALREDPEGWARAAERTAHAARGRAGEEALWLETFLTERAAGTLATSALVRLARETARGGWGKALARAGEALAGRGHAGEALEAAAGPGGRRMTQALLEAPAMRAWLAGQGGRKRGTPSAVAIALRGYSSESAEACRRAGAVLDAGAALELLELAAAGAMDGQAMRWMGKHMGEAMAGARPSAGLMRRLVGRGRRGVLALLAQRGHGARVRRAAREAAERADGTEGGWTLALVAELGAAGGLSQGARRALATSAGGTTKVATVPSKLSAQCGVGPAWAFEAMVAGRGEVAQILTARAMGGEEAALRGAEIDAATALAGGTGDAEGLEQALEAQGWTPERARKVVAVRPGAGRDPGEALGMAGALAALGARRRGRRGPSAASAN